MSYWLLCSLIRGGCLFAHVARYGEFFPRSRGLDVGCGAPLHRKLTRGYLYPYTTRKQRWHKGPLCLYSILRAYGNVIWTTITGNNLPESSTPCECIGFCSRSDCCSYVNSAFDQLIARRTKWGQEPESRWRCGWRSVLRASWWIWARLYAPISCRCNMKLRWFSYFDGTRTSW